MTNLTLNSQNRLFSCSGIGLLIGFLVFHPIKISFVKPGACAIIFSTALLVNEFMKQRNKKLKMLYKLLLMQPLFSYYLQRRYTKPEICTLTCKRYYLIDPKYFKVPFFFNIDFLFRCFINLNTGEAVLNIIGQASGFTKLIFSGRKTRNSVSSPIPEHENSRFWLCRYKFVIVEQATAFAEVLSYT